MRLIYTKPKLTDSLSNYFDKISNKGIMTNHENGKARPTYFTIKDKEIL